MATQSAQPNPFDQFDQPPSAGPWQKYARPQQPAGSSVYYVRAPDGTKYRITAPDDATQEQVLDYAQTQHAQLRGPWNNYAKPPPTREQVSNAFYRAKAAGDEGAARQLIGYIQQHGMTLAPMNPDQKNAAFEKINAQNVNDVNDVTLGVPGVDALQFTFHAPPAVARTVAGVGEGAANFYRGIKQHAYDSIADAIDGGNRSAQAQQQVAESRRLSEALNNTAAGKLGNIAGSIASSAPLALVPGGGETLLARTGLAALAGGGFGYIAPSASEGEHVANTLMGAATGPLAVGAGKVAQLLGRGGKALLQRYVAPDAVASGQIGKILAGESVTPDQLRAYTDPVPGVRPTIAQALQTPKAVQLERAARNNPVSGPEIAAQDLQNNAARASILQQHVLPTADLAAARVRRAANFAPIADALQDAGFVDPGPLRFEAANLAQRGNNAMTRSAAKKVLSFIDDNTAQAGENIGMIPVSDLHTLQHDLGTIVKKANPEAIDTSQALHELQPFKQAIQGTVDSIVPGYQAALRQYAQDSAPIGTSRTIADLLNPSKATATDLTGEPTLTAARIKSVLSKDDRAPFKLSPQARTDAEDVQASIQSRNAAQRSIGPSGSPTEANRQAQLIRRGAGLLAHGGAGAAAGSFLGPVGSIAGLLGGVGFDALDRAAQSRIAGALGRLVANPNASANALEDYLNLQARRRALDEILAPNLLGRNWLGYGSGLVPQAISNNRLSPAGAQ